MYNKILIKSNTLFNIQLLVHSPPFPHPDLSLRSRPWPVRAKALCKATKRETLCGMDAECRTLKPARRFPEGRSRNVQLLAVQAITCRNCRDSEDLLCQGSFRLKFYPSSPPLQCIIYNSQLQGEHPSSFFVSSC